MAAHHERVRRLGRAGLARAAGCHIETIRHYEAVGLMPKPERSAKGWRVYDDGHVVRLRFILRARALGFSTADIAGLLALGDHGAETCGAVRLRADRHLADIRARIADLRRVEAVLAEAVARCSDGAVPTCPLLDTLARP